MPSKTDNWAHATAVRIAIKEGRIEDYLFIDGPHMSAREAARRVGVTRRTIQRYRRALRQNGQHA